MPQGNLTLLDVEKGCVVAPAGCGKTEMIVEALRRYEGSRPCLVLTHTNAGVGALRARLSAAKVPPRGYRLATIDGWAMRLTSTFPMRSGVSAKTLSLSNPGQDYPRIRDCALGLLQSGAIEELVRTTYSRIVVDEYQDCGQTQHALVKRASQSLPTVILGDPLQAIFGFGGAALPNWDDEVCSFFGVTETLDTPWRWLNAGNGDLGYWLLEVRNRLLMGKGIDLTDSPNSVRWIELGGGAGDYKAQIRAGQSAPPLPGGTVLIIADSRKPHEQRRFASQIAGATTVEAVDLRDFISFADGLDLESADVLERVVGFAATIMANLGANDLLRRVATLARGSARKEPSDAEAAALRFRQHPTLPGMAELLETLNRQVGVRVFRPAVLRACFHALRKSALDSAGSFGDAARRVREEYRSGHRVSARRAVGSTLLLKGLEADMAVILDADLMDARHLYVAMTRGARKLIVCSRSDHLSPS